MTDQIAVTANVGQEMLKAERCLMLTYLETKAFVKGVQQSNGLGDGRWPTIGFIAYRIKCFCF